MAAVVPEIFHKALEESGISVEQAAKYYATFLLFDKDKSGAMDTSELFMCLQVLGQAPKTQEEVDEILKEHDKDSSGTIDFLEFAMMMGMSCKPTHDVRDDLVSSFQVFDKDHSGYLDRQELHDAIYSMGNVNLTEKEFDQLMQDADTNGDGKVDYSEFAALLLADVSKMIESSKEKLAKKQEKQQQEGSKENKDQGSKENKDQGSKENKGQGSKDNKGQGSKENKDHGPKENKDHGPKENKDHGPKEHKDRHGDKDKDKHHHRSRKHSGGSGGSRKSRSGSRSSRGSSRSGSRGSSRSGHSKKSGKSD